MFATGTTLPMAVKKKVWNNISLSEHVNFVFGSKSNYWSGVKSYDNLAAANKKMPLTFSVHTICDITVVAGQIHGQ